MKRLPLAVRYLRVGEALGPDDLRDLESYYEGLRAYYGIPDDQPVFPPEPTPKSPGTPDTRRPASQPKKATGRNRDDHPWRNTL